MYYFDADARDGFGAGNGTCNTCCPATADAVPGETNMWRIGYADWLQGIQGRGLFDAGFSFEKTTPDPVAPFPTVLPPTNTNYAFQIEANSAYSGTVATNGVSPQSTPLTYALDPVNPPTHGVVAMNSNGTFVYVPTAGYIGIDDFNFVTSDGINLPVSNMVSFGVDVIVASAFPTPFPAGVIDASGGESAQQVYETPLPPSQGLIYVPPETVRMNGFYLQFGLFAAPGLLINQIYRMTVATRAMDCARQTFRHISSYDIRISSCGLP
jgi:hypothetical protein